jgi:hypothetical protein
MQEPMRVIARSALVLPLGFVAQLAHQHHPPSAGEYAKVLEDPRRDAWAEAAGSGERSRTDQNEVRQVDGKRPYPANLCSSSGGVEFAGFGEDLGEPIGELIETMSGRAVRQRATEHLDSMLGEE